MTLICLSDGAGSEPDVIAVPIPPQLPAKKMLPSGQRQNASEPSFPAPLTLTTLMVSPVLTVVGASHCPDALNAPVYEAQPPLGSGCPSPSPGCPGPPRTEPSEGISVHSPQHSACSLPS